MRTTKTMTVSLPPAMLRQFELVRRAEGRTRSELFREALRAYFESRYPAVPATPAETAAFARARAEFRRGNAVSLRQFFNAMERPAERARAKGPAKVARKRRRAR